MSDTLNKINQNFSYMANGEIGVPQEDNIGEKLINCASVDVGKINKTDSEEELVELDITDNLTEESKIVTDEDNKTGTESVDQMSETPDIQQAPKTQDTVSKEEEIAINAKETALKLRNMICSHEDNRSEWTYSILYYGADALNLDLIFEEYKNLTERDLVKDIEIMCAYNPVEKEKIDSFLLLVQSFEKSDSQVDNKYHPEGDEYSIVRDGAVFTITNKTTQEERQIDLKILLANYTNPEDRRHMMYKMQQLPGEVLMDIAAEQTSFMSYNSGEEIDIGDGKTCKAAAYYEPGLDTMYLDPNNKVSSIIHETGHSLDYNKISGQNESSVLLDEKFTELFNSELQVYLKAGNKRYEYDAEPASLINIYATANETEMFAECYTLLMTGKCNSYDVISKYFFRTFEYAKTLIEKNREQSDDIRH